MNIDDLKNEIDNIISIQKIIVLDISKKIDYIILNKIVNDNYIEKIFDELLNLFPTDDIIKLYKRLAIYYYKFNSELVCDYISYYNEMYLEDNEIDIKKLVK